MMLPAGLIDVFADAPLTGNPLAVVEDADALTEEQMRRIAGEFNQAETTFIMRSSRADMKLRSFTAAGVEVGGAGHNALGAWLWLAEEGRLGPIGTAQTFKQEIGDEVLPVVLHRIEGRFFGSMKQSSLQLLTVLDNTALLAKALGISIDEILDDPKPRVVGTGAAHLLVHLRNKTSVDRVVPSAELLLDVLRGVQGEGCYVYAHDLSSADQAYARFFNPTVGLWEDAATGTAAGPLAGYLAQQGRIGDKLAIEQGAKMGRRSILNIGLTPEPELSGAGVIVLRGAITL